MQNGNKAALVDFFVTKIVVESENIRSFYLQPVLGECPEYTPGEYLVFELTDSNGNKVKREYSISNWSKQLLRITIKREDPPLQMPDLPAGVMSEYFHQQLQVGDSLTAFGPAGKFNLQSSTRPVVLLGGGVGQTPLLAMAHALAEQGSRATTFIHACENGAVHALGAEITALKQSFKLLRSYVCYANPRSCDRLGSDYQSSGFISKEILQSLLVLDDYEFYLCGPGPFMQAMYNHLQQLGVDDSRIFYEFFGPATLLKKAAVTTEAIKLPLATTVADDSQPDADNTNPVITFSRSGFSVPWDPEFENLLEFAEEQDLMPDFSCRAGTCETCKTKIVQGQVSYPDEPMELPEEGYALICCAIPKGNISLDL
ncbi:MAG: 2Fe-2S iron-sulfur cluster-binding protein [Pseudomonadales bacterium]|nr:2Fe-2S iron-sulfur cluster-binding protein [Pseudomonadales bacterium]